MTWPQWTSQTDVGQWPPECCHTCLREPLITMASSDGRSDKIFLKWSSRTACSLGRTSSNMRCVEQLIRAKTICMAKTWNVVQRFNTCKAANT